MGSPHQSRHMADGADSKPRGNERPRAERKEVVESKPAAAPVVQKSTAELAAIQEKKRKLMAKYG